jgi:hypothetical protein
MAPEHRYRGDPDDVCTARAAGRIGVFGATADFATAAAVAAATARIAARGGAHAAVV